MPKPTKQDVMEPEEEEEPEEDAEEETQAEEEAEEDITPVKPKAKKVMPAGTADAEKEETPMQKYFNETLTRINLLAIGKVVIVSKYRDTNFLVVYDKLERPALTLQIDNADLTRLRDNLNSLKI